MTDPRVLIAPALAAAGLACFAAAWLCKPAHGAEITVVTAPPTGWQVQHADGSPWVSPRGYSAVSSSETACGLALAEASRLVASGTRLQCRRIAK